MIPFAQWLSEAFATLDPAQVAWSTDRYDNTTAKFPVGGKPYFVSFELDDEDKGGLWADAPSISFGVLRGRYEVPDAEQTRAGNQFQVFGAVLGVIHQYLREKRPIRFKFEPYYPGLVRVYQRMVGSLTGQYMQAPGTFKFTRVDIARQEMAAGIQDYVVPSAQPIPGHDPDQRIRRRNATYIASGVPRRAGA